ncbi:MAG: glycosyltransferase [Candidatus Hermodarchaeota archaeon]
MTSEINSLLDAYETLLGKETIEIIKNKAKQFKNKTMLHVNATKFGGGVAEILQNMVALMTELELSVNWKTFSAPDSFFQISKKMHNALQGDSKISFSNEEITQFLDQAKNSYDQIHPEEDFVIIHDPQPCPIIKFAEERKGKWTWRCHIDTSNPNPQAWELVLPYLQKYDARIFTMKQFAKSEVKSPIVYITPSINPFSNKNKELDHEEAKTIVQKYIPLNKPLITQISRFDPWKDPLGVIDAYKKVKEKVPVSLALIGSLAHDDPEGVEWLKKVKDYADNDENIYILSNLDGVGDIEVNALQRVSNVIIQKSIKEGFGLTVTEALWKKTPVIGGNVGGITLQIENGVNGFLVDSVEETVEKVIYLLNNPKIAKKMGERGFEKVKREFLLNKHAERYLDLFKILSK